MGTPRTDAKTARLWDEGFGYISVSMRPDELLCPECEGSGRVHYSNARGGFEYPSIEVCGHCDGRGVLEIEPLENEQ